MKFGLLIGLIVKFRRRPKYHLKIVNFCLEVLPQHYEMNVLKTVKSVRLKLKNIKSTFPQCFLRIYPIILRMLTSALIQ